MLKIVQHNTTYNNSLWELLIQSDITMEPLPPRLLFCSYHNYLDPTSGAARSTRDLFEMLAVRGWALRGGVWASKPILRLRLRSSHVMTSHGIRKSSVEQRHGDCAFSLYQGIVNVVPVTVFEPSQLVPKRPPTSNEGDAFLDVWERIQTLFRPDVLLTYGGHRFASSLMQLAQNANIKVVFTLRNFAYQSATLFQHVDAIHVPSETSRRHYQESLGIDSTAIAGPLDWSRFQCDSVDGRYVTFINPQPDKGLAVFARLAIELNRRRAGTLHTKVAGDADG